MPATEFARCHHLRQPWQCNWQKTHNTTPLKCCAWHAKWRWSRPKCCACHENCHASSENVAKALCLPRKTTFDTLRNTKCHACHAKRGYTTCETPKVTEFTIDTAIAASQEPLRTVANGCERLRTVAVVNATSSEHTLHAQTPRPPEWNGNPCYAFGQNLWNGRTKRGLSGIQKTCELKEERKKVDSGNENLDNGGLQRKKLAKWQTQVELKTWWRKPIWFWKNIMQTIHKLN